MKKAGIFTVLIAALLLCSCVTTDFEDDYRYSRTDNINNAPHEIIGSVEVSKYYWHFLFVPNTDLHRNELYNMALEEAHMKYGTDVILGNLRYRGYWSILSLFLYFDYLGYVENATLNANVFRKNNDALEQKTYNQSNKTNVNSKTNSTKESSARDDSNDEVIIYYNY